MFPLQWLLNRKQLTYIYDKRWHQHLSLLQKTALRAAMCSVQLKDQRNRISPSSIETTVMWSNLRKLTKTIVRSTREHKGWGNILSEKEIWVGSFGSALRGSDGYRLAKSGTAIPGLENGLSKSWKRGTSKSCAGYYLPIYLSPEEGHARESQRRRLESWQGAQSAKLRDMVTSKQGILIDSQMRQQYDENKQKSWHPKWILI